MAGRMLYLGTGVLGLVVAVVCAMFSIAAGLGWGYLLPTGAAVVLVSLGLIRSPGEPVTGAAISGCGAALAAFALVGGLRELVRAIPFGAQPEQGRMLFVPLLMLGVSVLHAGVAFRRWRRGWES